MPVTKFLLQFNYSELPELKNGEKRDYLMYSVGWVKDGDLNTATGNTVKPLPFHAMSRYPYGPPEHFPADKEHIQYLKEYNTRYISDQAFRNELVNSKEITSGNK